jgi:DEAD/DEAH box helicase domain-containing protein
MAKVIEATHFTDDDYVQPGSFFGKWTPRSFNAHLSIYSGVLLNDMKANKDAPVSVCVVLDDQIGTRTDKYENEWNGFWQFFNMMQFTERFAAVCTTGLEQMAYVALPVGQATAQATDNAPAEENDRWGSIRELLFDDEAIDMAMKLRNLGIAIPDEVGYELIDTSGEVIATIELAWTIQKIGFLTEEQYEDKEKLESIGWKVFTVSEEIDVALFKGVNSNG